MYIFLILLLYNGDIGRRLSQHTLAKDPARELDVFWKDGHTLRVYRAQVGVFKQTNQVRFRRLLQCKDGRALKAQIGHETLRKLVDEALERQFAYEEVCGLLVSSNVSHRDRSRPISIFFYGCVVGSLYGQRVASAEHDAGWQLLDACHHRCVKSKVTRRS